MAIKVKRLVFGGVYVSSAFSLRCELEGLTTKGNLQDLSICGSQVLK
jgi:hypothetical protein